MEGDNSDQEYSVNKSSDDTDDGVYFYLIQERCKMIQKQMNEVDIVNVDNKLILRVQNKTQVTSEMN